LFVCSNMGQSWLKPQRLRLLSCGPISHPSCSLCTCSEHVPVTFMYYMQYIFHLGSPSTWVWVLLCGYHQPVGIVWLCRLRLQPDPISCCCSYELMCVQQWHLGGVQGGEGNMRGLRPYTVYSPFILQACTTGPLSFIHHSLIRHIH